MGRMQIPLNGLRMIPKRLKEPVQEYLGREPNIQSQ